MAGQRFVDVTLACDGHQVHCHRLVLAACSSYFESLLNENPCKHPIIILPKDVKLWEIQALVDFMYKGQVNVSQAGLPQLLKCAETLQIRGLCGTDSTLNEVSTKNEHNSTTNILPNCSSPNFNFTNNFSSINKNFNHPTMDFDEEQSQPQHYNYNDKHLQMHSRTISNENLVKSKTNTNDTNKDIITNKKESNISSKNVDVEHYRGGKRTKTIDNGQSIDDNVHSIETINTSSEMNIKSEEIGKSLPD